MGWIIFVILFFANVKTSLAEPEGTSGGNLRGKVSSVGGNHRGLMMDELLEPCVLIAAAGSRQTTKGRGSPHEDEFFCCLQGVDSAKHGPQCLQIDGLNPGWFNSNKISSNGKKLRSGISTIFIRNAKIIGSMLQLPNGKSINDAVLDYDGYGEEGKYEDDEDSFPNRRLATVTGAKQTLVVRVDANIDTTNTITEITNEIFVNSPSFASQYSAMSFSKLQFHPASTVGTFSGLSNGGYTVNLSNFTIVDGVTKFPELAAAITTQLTNDFGAGWENTIDYYMYVMPRGTRDSSGGTWFGVAATNGKWSYYDDTYINNNAIVMHEVGHNLNLGHSGDTTGEAFPYDNKYDDQSCIMGGSVGQNEIHFNGPKSYQLGWYSNKTLDITSGTHWEGRVCGIVDYQDSAVEYVVIRIIDATSPEDDYYISFNRKASFNIDTAEGADMVLVTKRRNGVGIAPSWLEAELDESNPVYFVPGFGGIEGLSIVVTQIDLKSAPACAHVSILFGSSSPTISMSPTSSPAPTVVPGIDVPTTGTLSARALLFDVIATNEVCITGFRIHSDNVTHTVNIKTKAESIDTSLFNNWGTAVQVVSAIGAGQGAETDLPNLASPICIQAGETQAFRIQSSIHDTLFTTKGGSGVRNQDTNLKIKHAWIQTTTGYKAYYKFEGTIKYAVPQNRRPSNSPSMSADPSNSPTLLPSMSTDPSNSPTMSPSESTDPSNSPSTPASMSSNPSTMPTVSPSKSVNPSGIPTVSPSKSVTPSNIPTTSPSKSADPSIMPTISPSRSVNPSNSPTISPTKSSEPSIMPSASPSKSVDPTSDSTPAPSRSAVPSESLFPSNGPTVSPSQSLIPSSSPTTTPSKSSDPSNVPTATPSNSVQPSLFPSEQPSESLFPSESLVPSNSPTLSPSESVFPSIVPSTAPSESAAPSITRSYAPSESTIPSKSPSAAPSTSSQPSRAPTQIPSKSTQPSQSPTEAKECLVDGDCSDSTQCTNDECITGVCTYTDIPEGFCGDGICQENESCATCDDCKSKLRGKPDSKFCCYGGPTPPLMSIQNQYDGVPFIGCSDIRCGGPEFCIEESCNSKTSAPTISFAPSVSNSPSYPPTNQSSKKVRKNNKRVKIQSKTSAPSSSNSPSLTPNQTGKGSKSSSYKSRSPKQIKKGSHSSGSKSM